jgi:integrase
VSLTLGFGTSAARRATKSTGPKATARAVINLQPGRNPEYVFTYSKGQLIDRINTKAWRRAREEAGLPQVRVHDLKYTFGRRLRAKGVSHETRQVLLGHKNGQITTHYSAVEIGELIDAVEKVSWSGSSAPTLTLIRSVNSRRFPSRRSPLLALSRFDNIRT